MTCGLLMTRDPPTARHDESVGEAARRLIHSRIIELPVVDQEGRFLGMFGLADIFALVTPRIALAGGLAANLRFMSDDPGELRRRFAGVASRPVGEMAERDVPVVHSDTPESEALRLFGEGRTTLAVVERGTRKLLGILSYWDAVAALTGLAPDG